MKASKNGRVNVSGTVSWETAQAWERGDLKYNNGLRQAHGRPSLNPEQPDIHLDKTPTAGQQLLADLKADAADGLRYCLSCVWYEVVVPNIQVSIQDRFIPWIRLKWHELLTPAAKRSMDRQEQATSATQETIETSERSCRIVDLNSYRAASGQ